MNQKLNPIEAKVNVSEKPNRKMRRKKKKKPKY